MGLFRRRRVSDSGPSDVDSGKNVEELADAALPIFRNDANERAALEQRMDEELHPYGDPSRRNSQYTGD